VIATTAQIIDGRHSERLNQMRLPRSARSQRIERANGADLAWMRGHVVEVRPAT
jgi:hypothetical protein